MADNGTTFDLGLAQVSYDKFRQVKLILVQSTFRRRLVG